MRKVLIVGLLSSALAGCMGYSARDAEVIGQAKRLSNVTPLLCFDYMAFDLSLGIMQNGTGSMSREDKWFVVGQGVNVGELKKAVERGAIVKVVYDEQRMAPCSEHGVMTAFTAQ